MSYSLEKSFLFLFLIALLVTQQSQAQLTHNDQEHLKQLARKDVHRVLEGDFASVDSDLQTLAEASLTLEILEALPESGQVCSAMKKHQKTIVGQADTSVKALYHLAQINRLFKCETLKSLPQKLSATLSSSNKDLEVTEQTVYYVYQLKQNAKILGIKDSNTTILSDKGKDILLQALNKNDWTYNGNDKAGITLESLRAAKVLASLTKDKKVGSEVLAFLKVFFHQQNSNSNNKRLIQLDDGEIFSFMTSNSGKSKELDGTDLNLYLLEITDYLGNDDLTKEQKQRLRNYFLQKAKFATNTRQALNSVRALKHLKDIPLVRQSDNKRSAVAFNDGKATLKFEIIDSFGNPLTSADKLEVQLQQLDGSKPTKDITANSKLNKDKNEVTVQFIQHEIGKYEIRFTINSYVQALPLTITDTLLISSMAYQLTSSSSFPSKLEHSLSYPAKISNLPTATDGNYLHISASASFSKFQGQAPSQVYLSLKKHKENEKNLVINSYATLTGNKYQITFDFSKRMEHLNGDYDLTLHVADYRADQSQTWDLGRIKIWFKEGQDEGQNTGIKTEYKTAEHIEFNLPPPEKEISPIIPFFIVGIWALLFMRYFNALISNKANLSRLSFFGLLFIVVILAILGIFTLFWINVKLTAILWILLFFSPVAFFISFKALQQADCTIGEFKTITSKKRVD